MSLLVIFLGLIFVILQKIFSKKNILPQIPVFSKEE
jgi:hypothetical protein